MGRCRSVSLLGCPFSVGLSFSVFSLQRSLSHPSCCSVILANIFCLSSLICESWSQTLFLPGETHAHLPNASPALSLQAWSSPLLLKPLVPSVWTSWPQASGSVCSWLRACRVLAWGRGVSFPVECDLPQGRCSAGREAGPISHLCPLGEKDQSGSSVASPRSVCREAIGAPAFLAI